MIKPIKPMLAKDNSHDKPFFQKEDYLLQEKYDGTRILAIKKHGHWYLMTRLWKNDVSNNFPEIIKELSGIKSSDVILDGELIFLKKNKVKFLTVLAKPETKKGFTVKFMIFDVIRFNGDVTKIPLIKRLDLLQKIIPKPTKYIKVVKTIKSPSMFKQIYNKIIKRSGEGVMIKKKDSPYVFDSREHWIKVKKSNTEDCVVIGITYGLGKRKPTFGALILAQYDRTKQLRIVGKTSGFDDVTLKQLYTIIMKMPPYHYPYLKMNGVKKWVPPKIVVEVRYAEKTAYGILRHPVFMRIRDDKSPRECVIKK